jgi:N utilization substance protein B
VQALYQWQVGGGGSADIRTEFRERDGMNNVDWAYFDALVDGVIREVDSLDTLLTPRLDRAVSSLDPVERAILRLATLELRDHPDVPFRVVINESIELARTFGAEQSHRYVNGVLDALARDVRPREAHIARS